MSTEESKPAPPEQSTALDSAPKSAGSSALRRRWLRIALIAIGAFVIVFVVIPRIFHAWHSVSTDDGFVNSYVTFVAPRVTGQVARVLVDDNNRVKKGDVLVELDPEPFRVQVAIK